jgi:hypothetical protein
VETAASNNEGVIVYEVKRENGKVIVTKGSHSKLNAPEDSYVVFKDANGVQHVSKLKELNDEQLLLALANAIDIPS